MSFGRFFSVNVWEGIEKTDVTVYDLSSYFICGKTGKELRAAEEIDRKSGITGKWFVRSMFPVTDRK